MENSCEMIQQPPRYIELYLLRPTLERSAQLRTTDWFMFWFKLFVNLYLMRKLGLSNWVHALLDAVQQTAEDLPLPRMAEAVFEIIIS